MSSILDEIDDTLFSGDLTLIKDKIFKRCNGQNIGTLELIDVYTLVRQLEIPFSDIDWLIENGLCIEIPRAIKNVPSLKGATFGEKTPETIFPKVSNLAVCKEYMEDKEQFCKEYCDGLVYYDYDDRTRNSIDRFIMCCYLSMTPEIEFEYSEYMKEHKPTVKTDCSNLFGQLSSGNISSNWYSPRYGVVNCDSSAISAYSSSDLASNLASGGDYN